MPATQARQFRLGDETVAMINNLAEKWGGTLTPTSHTEVIREAVRRAHEAEFPPTTRTKKEKAK